MALRPMLGGVRALEGAEEEGRMKLVSGRAGSRVGIEMVRSEEVGVVVRREACMGLEVLRKYSRTMMDERAMMVGHQGPADVRCFHVAEE